MKEEVKHIDGSYILELYRATKNGTLTLTHYDDNREEEIDRYYIMDWTEEDAQNLAKKFEEFRWRLDYLGKLHDSLTTMEEKGEDLAFVLDPQMLDVWNTFLAPFPEHGLDPEQLHEVLEKDEFDEPMSEEEEELICRYMAWYDNVCRQRLPNNRSASTRYINRAKRYERLSSLRAPKIVVENEARFLAEEMVIYYAQRL